MNYQKILISCALSLSVVACSIIPSSLNPLNSFQPTQTVERFLIQESLVVDSSSSLMWTRCLQGTSWNGLGCSGTPMLYNWQQARNLTKTMNYGGYNDWRVPTIEELKTLADKGISGRKNAIPYINQTVFPGTNCHDVEEGLNAQVKACWQWSSSPIEGSEHYAWTVYFGYGYGNANYETDSATLRLVRNR